jgi:hypothetical protein
MTVVFMTRIGHGESIRLGVSGDLLGGQPVAKINTGDLNPLADLIAAPGFPFGIEIVNTGSATLVQIVRLDAPEEG